LDREKGKLRDTTQEYLALRHRSLVYERESEEARAALQGAVNKLCAEKVGLLRDASRCLYSTHPCLAAVPAASAVPDA
jgi:hypothetical protein